MAKKILIAEDEEYVRLAIKLAFAADNYEIYEARDGVEALDMAKQVKPDLIILDVMMPGKSGYQVCETLKADQEYKKIYILFLTARSMQKARGTAVECGGDDFLGKPFRVNELRERVVSILGH